MTRNHGIHRIVAAIIVGMIVLSLSTSTGRDRRNYEIDAQVYSVPPAQSDAARAINAYERLMERHMDMTERHLAGLAEDIKMLAAEFDAVDARFIALDARLTQMDRRLARIEKHLGTAPESQSAPAKPDPNAPATLKAPVDNSPATPQ
jgi:septal ring factor EnvC (AmiA/AmiB activator)